MTPKLLAKIQRLADDPRTDSMTRKIAQAQIDSHNGVTSSGVHPGLRQSAEHQAWLKIMKETNVAPRK